MVSDSHPEGDADLSRRDLLLGVTLALSGAGLIAGAYPFISSWNPGEEVEAQRTAEVDLSGIAPGSQSITTWQGRPLLIVHRTPEWIRKAQDSEGPIEPQPDSERTKRPEWLIVVGVCTHLGCVPNFAPSDTRLWICPCHGSEYDFSARVTKGPAPQNLEVPPYRFEGDERVVVG